MVLDSLILTKKLPSPHIKPDNQLGSLIVWSNTKGLWIGLTEGKVFFNSSERPLFILALIATSFLIPSIVKCFFFV